MNKTAFIFPGQGAQYVGMAIDLLENNNEFNKPLDIFKERTDFDLYKIIFEGPEEKLKETQFTQPAILFHSVTAWKAFSEEIDLKPAFVAGHSLGEFSALVANGVLGFEDAMYLVHKRGQFMMKANEGKPFAMYAIIGLTPDEVKNICAEASKVDVVIAAKFNTPVQTVISGSKAGVEKAGELAAEAGAKRIIPLAVGGPFHSPLIEKAGIWLAEEMEGINFNNADIPVVSNVDAKPEVLAENIKKNLAKQVTSSVLWVDSINYMLQQGVEQFIEFGPQKVLAGMMRKIDKKITVYSVDKFEDVSKLKENLEL